jgi:hypothetical protein
MKKNLLLILALVTAMSSMCYSQKTSNDAEPCNAVVINDTEEQNGVFISGTSGQKAAVDIPIASDIQMTLTGIKVTLSSVDVPTYVHLRFYNDTLSTPEDPQEPPQEVPGDIMFDVTDCTIDTFEIVGYEPMHSFTVRNITLSLQQPIVLKGNLVQGRFWMGVLSDANAWASTAHYDTGADVIGEAVAMGSDNFDWFTLMNIEGLYELTADCETTVSAFNAEPEQQVSIYPNPASDVLIITGQSGQRISKIELYTIAGIKVKECENQQGTIDISDLSNGLYLVRVVTLDNSVTYRKIVKNQ